MVKNRKGLIVNVSSFGGKMFLFNPVYGVGKAGCDKMARDCAKELKVMPQPVGYLSTLLYKRIK
jgi:dehydrogenase/reductase SDR family member 1